MRTLRLVSMIWLTAVAAAMVLGVAGAPAAADESRHHAKSSADKAMPRADKAMSTADRAMLPADAAMPMDGMKSGFGDAAKGGRGIAPAATTAATPASGTPASGTTALLMPMMNPERGRKVYAAKGCITCHAINGVGGDHGPSLDMSDMGAMNPFDFAAKMWEGAEAMIAQQKKELGQRISLTGQDLADLIAFVHSPDEIAKFSVRDIPRRIQQVFRRAHGEAHGH